VAAWLWAALGLALVGVEILVPGLFLVWFGAAGVVTALAAWAAPGLDFTIQLGLFVFVSGSLIGGTLMRQGVRDRAAEALGEAGGPPNDRMGDLLGRTAVLADPIVNGRGRVFFGDTLWQVAGPDRPAGTPVRVTGHRGTVLTVEPVE
jgi:membrane protein implicated in regulation of membrane protease activity